MPRYITEYRSRIWPVIVALIAVCGGTAYAGTTYQLRVPVTGVPVVKPACASGTKTVIGETWPVDVTVPAACQTVTLTLMGGGGGGSSTARGGNGGKLVVVLHNGSGAALPLEIRPDRSVWAVGQAGTGLLGGQSGELTSIVSAATGYGIAGFGPGGGAGAGGPSGGTGGNGGAGGVVEMNGSPSTVSPADLALMRGGNSSVTYAPSPCGFYACGSLGISSSGWGYANGASGFQAYTGCATVNGAWVCGGGAGSGRANGGSGYPYASAGGSGAVFYLTPASLPAGVTLQSYTTKVGGGAAGGAIGQPGAPASATVSWGP